MTTFSDNEVETFIELVKECPALYNPQHASYNDDRVRSVYWNNIAKAMNKSDSECRKKWKLLKDSYNRCKRRRLRSKSGERAKNSKWQLFERLRFVEDTMNGEAELQLFEGTLSEDAVPVATEDGFESSTSSMEAEYLLSDSPFREEPVEIKAPVRKKSNRKRKRFDIESPRLIEERDESRLTMQQTAFVSEPLDDISSFVNYIEVSLRNLSVRSKSMAKKDIINVITKYEMIDIDAGNPLGTSFSNNTECLLKVEPSGSGTI